MSFLKKLWFKIIVFIILFILILGIGFVIFKSISYTGVMSTDIWFSSDEYSQEQIPSLVKDEGDDFTILVLSDIQLESSPFKDRQALEIIDKLVIETKPDLIVTTGDNTSWTFSDIETKDLIKQLDSYNIPWTVTLGNHDSEGRADRNWHGNQYQQAQNSLFNSGPSNIHGIGNHGINIVDQADNILYSLIMLDSNVNRIYPEGEDYDFIYADQIAWYEWMIRGASKERYGEYNPTTNKVVPSMLFFHIALPEFQEAADAVAGGLDSSLSFGENKEGVFSAPVNSGLFTKAQELQSTTHMTVGHDHVNSLSVDWEGIRLTYGLKTGPTSYFDEGLQGGTLITITDDSASIEHVYV